MHQLVQLVSLRRRAAALLTAVGIIACGLAGSAQQALPISPDPADGPEAPPGAITPAPGFIPIGEALPGEDPAAHRGLRHTEGGVELYSRKTDLSLRRYLPGRAATAWAHAAADRWLVALEGGQVVEVNFASETTHDIATFDGDVHWMSVDRGHVLPTLRMAIADHRVGGIGKFPLLYVIDPEARTASVHTLDTAFDRIVEDDFGRAWFLPLPGTELEVMQYVLVASGEVRSIRVPPMEGNEPRRFGSVLQIPEGPFLVWGIGERLGTASITWVAELNPPIFDDAEWQDSQTFQQPPRAWRDVSAWEWARGIQRGTVSLSYEAERDVVLFYDLLSGIGQIARPDMSRWVAEDDYAFLLLLEGRNEWDEPTAPPIFDPRFAVDLLPLEGWPEAYLDRLREEPTQRIARFDPDRPTDPLIESILNSVMEVRGDEPVHVSARCDTAWVLGFDNGVIAHADQSAGGFAFSAWVPGVPTAIDLDRDEESVSLRVEYMPRDLNQGRSRRRTFVFGQEGWAQASDDLVLVEKPFAWLDRRSVEMAGAAGAPGAAGEPGEGVDVVWTDPIRLEEFHTIKADDGLHLIGLMELPDGRVIGFGSDRQAGSNLPVLVDVTRGRDGFVWHRDIGHLCEQWPLPEAGFTHAAYIPEARRILLVAEGKVWSTDLGFGDWRQELASLPAGWGEDDDGEADE